MSPNSVVPLFLILLVLQRNVDPLDAGTPIGPAVSQLYCNVYFLLQVWFPWSTRLQQTAFAIYRMHCLPGFARVLLEFQSGSSDWFHVWFIFNMLKSNEEWCIIKFMADSHWVRLLFKLDWRYITGKCLPYITGLFFGDWWGVTGALLILGWSMLPWATFAWYPTFLYKWHVGG